MLTRRSFITSLLALPFIGKALVMAGVNPYKYLGPERLVCQLGYWVSPPAWYKDNEGHIVPLENPPTEKIFKKFDISCKHVSKMLHDPELDKPSPYYMPNAPEYPEMIDEMNEGGSYRIGDMFKMPKMWHNDK